ncbi:hypothetical protein Tco_1386162 [Tanacetum coccineum]
MELDLTPQANHVNANSEASQEGEEVGRVYEKEEFGFDRFRGRKPEAQGGKVKMIPQESSVQDWFTLLQQRIAEEEELTEQQKKRKAQVQFEAQHYINEDWDLIREKLEANAEFQEHAWK